MCMHMVTYKKAVLDWDFLEVNFSWIGGGGGGIRNKSQQLLNY